MNSILTVSMLACVSNCNKPSIRSTWATEPIVIDGDQLEWNSLLTTIEGYDIATGVMNDTQWLYLCIVSNNEDFNRQTLMQGLTLWFKHPSLKSDKFGARFSPAIHQGVPFPPRPMGQNSDERFNPSEHQFKPELQTIELIGPNNDSKIIASTVAVRYGIESAIGVADEKATFEIKLPLQDMDSTLFSLHMTTDTLLSITVETRKMMANALPPRPAGMAPNGNGGGPDRGMGPTPGGMMGGSMGGGRGPMGGNPPGQGGMQMPSQIRFDCKVIIAKSAKAGH